MEERSKGEREFTVGSSQLAIRNKQINENKKSPSGDLGANRIGQQREFSVLSWQLAICNSKRSGDLAIGIKMTMLRDGNMHSQINQP